jgi:hypothetical protein
MGNEQPGKQRDKLDQVPFCDLIQGPSGRRRSQISASINTRPAWRRSWQNCRPSAQSRPIDALRHLGAMLKETPRAKGGQPYQATGTKMEPVEPPTAQL